MKQTSLLCCSVISYLKNVTPVEPRSLLHVPRYACRHTGYLIKVMWTLIWVLVTIVHFVSIKNRVCKNRLLGSLRALLSHPICTWNKLKNMHIILSLFFILYFHALWPPQDNIRRDFIFTLGTWKLTHHNLIWGESTRGFYLGIKEMLVGVWQRFNMDMVWFQLTH